VTNLRAAAYRESVNAMPASLPARQRGLREERSLAAAAEAHLDDVYRYVLYLTGDRNVAEDLTNTTFERALHRWSRFDPGRGSAKTWLCQLARGAALDHFRAEQRRRRREEAYAATSPEATETTFGDGLSPALDIALAELSAGEREVVALRVVLELDGEQAARVLGISPTACSTRLSRALAKLAERMDADVRA
jgi:RNA polymerase sigma factor (sigma-70 family)